MNAWQRARNLLWIAKAYRLVRIGIDERQQLERPRYWRDLVITLASIREVHEMFNALKGYKTYLVAVLMGTLTAMKALGYVDDATYDMLIKLLLAGGTATVAAKINRIAQNQ